MKIFALLFALLIGCSDSEPAATLSPDAGNDSSDVSNDRGAEPDSSTTPDLGNETDASKPDSGNEPDFGDGPFGGDRPAEIFLPSDYDPSNSYPLVVLLHGYMVSGVFQDWYFELSEQVNERQFILVVPDGRTDAIGAKYWNATPFCCGAGERSPDDKEYLIGLVTEAEQRYSVNSDAVYFVGHSNGGFMSYTLACEYGDRISGIVSLAGSTFFDASLCPDTGDVAILQVHGTLDAVVLYGGSLDTSYPGAEEVTARWAERNGCDAAGVSNPDINLAATIPGSETEVTRWLNCNSSHADVMLWSIRGAGHIPGLNDDFTPMMLDHLFARTK